MAASQGFKYHVILFAKQTLGRMKASIPTIVKYSKAELTPPKLSELGEVKQGISNVVSAYKSKSWKNLTVREAWLNTLVALEVTLWFFVGEVIGRRHLVGYHQRL